MPGFLTNDLPMLAQVSQNMRVPVDTELPRGVNPASVAASALQIAGTLMECLSNAVAWAAANTIAGTSFGGVSTSANAQNAAPGAAVTVTLNNPLITAAYLAAGGIPQAAMYSAANTGGNVPPDYMSALMVLQSVTPAVGSCTFVWINQGASALNGTMVIVWHL